MKYTPCSEDCHKTLAYLKKRKREADRADREDILLADLMRNVGLVGLLVVGVVSVVFIRVGLGFSLVLLRFLRPIPHLLKLFQE